MNLLLILKRMSTILVGRWKDREQWGGQSCLNEEYIEGNGGAGGKSNGGGPWEAGIVQTLVPAEVPKQRK